MKTLTKRLCCDGVLTSLHNIFFLYRKIISFEFHVSFVISYEQELKQLRMELHDRSNAVVDKVSKSHYCSYITA
jgi:hypothetical protein